MLIVFAFALNNRKNQVETTCYVRPLVSIATIGHRWTSRIIYYLFVSAFNEFLVFMYLPGAVYGITTSVRSRFTMKNKKLSITIAFALALRFVVVWRQHPFSLFDVEKKFAHPNMVIREWMGSAIERTFQEPNDFRSYPLPSMKYGYLYKLFPILKPPMFRKMKASTLKPRE